jgi:LAS superfamily LD-carboxypeptidase LdcB
MGKFKPANHGDFVEIPIKYADRPGQYLRKETFAAFQKMYEAAAKDGVILQIRSATRNFDDQKRIWENKWTGKTLLEDNTNAARDIKQNLARAKKILEYSSMPGTSRHHWGTDMDLNAFTNEWFDTGEGLKLYQWMQKYAYSYGFCQPYSKMGSDRKTGYFEEKWHWTYMPLSVKYTKAAKKMIKNRMITGFLGSETATEIDMVKNYILGISPSCLPNDQ